jgi:hypothetical protein
VASHPLDEPTLFGDMLPAAPQGSVLAQTWDYPPFSVLNAREGWWQDRKAAWLALGIESELGRGGELIPNGGATPASNGMRGGADVGRQPAGDAEGPKLLSGRAAPGGSLMPATDYSNRQRGDGKGRPIK